MRVHESPNVPFTVLYTRFPQGKSSLIVSLHIQPFLYILNVAPLTIIYDNACNLHNYTLNRTPSFFKNAWFLVDRFHWHNHTGKITISQSYIVG